MKSPSCALLLALAATLCLGACGEQAPTSGLRSALPERPQPAPLITTAQNAVAQASADLQAALSSPSATPATANDMLQKAHAAALQAQQAARDAR